MDPYERKQRERHGSGPAVLAWVVAAGLAIWGIIELLQWLGWIGPF